MPVSMATLVKADAQEEDAHVKEELGPVRVTVNSMDLNTKKPVNSLIEEDESEEAMRRRFKVRGLESDAKRRWSPESARAHVWCRDATNCPVSSALSGP